jgi:hypothetical protein
MLYYLTICETFEYNIFPIELLVISYFVFPTIELFFVIELKKKTFCNLTIFFLIKLFNQVKIVKIIFD